MNSFCVIRVDPGAKSIVFSQWNEMLAILGTALEQNHVRSIRQGQMSTKSISDAVTRFTTDDSLSVLLLPTKRAGKGLNITAASHVFLVEPMLTPGRVTAGGRRGGLLSGNTVRTQKNR